MLQDQSRNRTAVPAAQPPAGSSPSEPKPARTEAGIVRMLGDPPHAPVDSGDCVERAIEAHKSAHASLTIASNRADTPWVRQTGGDTSAAAMAAATDAWHIASEVETSAWERLLSTRPQSSDGLLRMLRYIASAAPMEVLGDARDLGRHLVEAAEAALVRWEDADAVLLCLGRRYDALHATWREAEDAGRELFARRDAAIAVANASGADPIKAHSAAWDLPGVQEAHERAEEALGALDPVCEAIRLRTARSIAGLAVKARANICQTWPAGDFERAAALGLDEESPMWGVRHLIEACCEAAGVDWRGQPIAGAARLASVTERILVSWREFAPAMLAGQGGFADAEALELSVRQNEALTSADKLPATLDNIWPKALALAAIEIVNLDVPSNERTSHSLRERLLLDIHAAICGGVVLGA